MKKNIIIVALVLIVPLVAFWILSNANTTTAQTNPEIPQTDQVVNEVAIGKPQILKFTSTMCLDCQTMNKLFKEVYPKYQDKIVLTEISVQDGKAFTNEQIKKYNITFKVSRGRYSYLHPNRSKYITGRSLGTLYEEKHLLQIFQENSTVQITENPVPDISQVVNSSTPTVSAYTATTTKTTEAPHTFLFIKSDLRLVTDLQHCIKAQQSQAYAQKVKLSNLKMMAQTVAYVQEHGFQSKADLDAALSDASAQSTDARNTLKSTENTLKNVNEQIHYTGQYLANNLYILITAKVGTKKNFMMITGQNLHSMNLPSEYSKKNHRAINFLH